MRGKPASAGRLPLAPLAPLIVPSDDAPNVGDVFDEVCNDCEGAL